MYLLSGQSHSASLLLGSMIPLDLQKGFYYRLRDSKIPEKEQLQDPGPRLDLVKWLPMCLSVTQDSQGEKQASQGYTHNDTALSPKLSPNKLNTPHVSNSSLPVLSLYLLQLGFHLSHSAETALVQVINHPHVAESNGASSVHIILHESTALNNGHSISPINALSSLRFQDTRLSRYPGTLTFQVLLLDSSSSQTLNIGVPKSRSSVSSL